MNQGGQRKEDDKKEQRPAGEGRRKGHRAVTLHTVVGGRIERAGPGDCAPFHTGNHRGPGLHSGSMWWEQGGGVALTQVRVESLTRDVSVANAGLRGGTAC